MSRLIDPLRPLARLQHNEPIAKLCTNLDRSFKSQTFGVSLVDMIDE